MNASLGAKHQCGGCAAKFYDLNQSPPTCPKCGVTVKLRAKPARSRAIAAAAPKKKPKEKETPVEALVGMGAVVELEELDDFGEDVALIEEVEDHQEEPETDINSDDAEDGMFIEEIAVKDAALFDTVAEPEEDPDKG